MNNEDNSSKHKDLVKIVIPIYKSALTDLEYRSLQQANKILKEYPLIVVKPTSLDLSSLLKEFPLLQTKSFDDSFFRGIAGYNRLMLSEIFYQYFLDAKYILIYQLDAYVFTDQLIYWCNKDYDYIGAPWLKKEVYNFPIISSFMKLRKWYNNTRGRKNKQQLYNKVGNGGFSLRKVESHFKTTILLKDKISHYLENKGHMYYEDVFWATEPDFNYPSATEALAFSFDKYPAYGYKLNKKKLPFGCHAWYKRKMKKFWKPIIGF